MDKVSIKICDSLDTRELCLELFEKIVIGGKETVTAKPQEVHIYYKIDIGSIL